MEDEQINRINAQLNTVEATIQRLSLSRSKVFQLLASGELRSVKVGRRRLVSEQAIHDFIVSLEGGAA